MTTTEENLSRPLTVLIVDCPTAEEIKKSLFPAPAGRNKGTTKTVTFKVISLDESRRQTYPGTPELDGEVTIRGTIRLVENRFARHTWTLCGAAEILFDERNGENGSGSLFAKIRRYAKHDGSHGFFFSAVCTPSDKTGIMHIGVTPMEHCEH